MKSVRFYFGGIIVKILNLMLGPFRRVRGLIIKTLIMVEKGSDPEESLRWLLDIHGYVENLIDNQCVAWGNGVHVKHEIMDGIHSFFYTRVPEGANVLDIGCGIGAVAHSIAIHTHANVTGIDLNAESVAFASRRFSHPNLCYLVGDATRDLPKMEVDVIVLSSVLEHLPDRIGFLQRLVSRFHPCHILIRVPTFDRHYLAPLKKRLGLYAYNDPSHIVEYSPETFRMEMESAGLTIWHMEIRWGDIWAECNSC